MCVLSASHPCGVWRVCVDRDVWAVERMQLANVVHVQGLGGLRKRGVLYVDHATYRVLRASCRA